jgi:hypothetical protein
MSICLWGALGVAIFVGACKLAFLIQAISVTYQMLKGRCPDIRKGAWWASGSILSEAIVKTIHYQTALDQEHQAHSGTEHREGFSSLGDSYAGHSSQDGISHSGF